MTTTQQVPPSAAAAAGDSSKDSSRNHLHQQEDQQQGGGGGEYRGGDLRNRNMRNAGWERNFEDVGSWRSGGNAPSMNRPSLSSRQQQGSFRNNPNNRRPMGAGGGQGERSQGGPQGGMYSQNGNNSRPFQSNNSFRSSNSNLNHRPNARWPTMEQDSQPVQKDGTWATRDGRRPYQERELEVFKSTKDKMTGINFDSYDQIEVELSGRNTKVIEPLTSFKAAADMPLELKANIVRVRYDKPTPVQKYAIPILLADRDLMACAQTGSGKTAAFLFPIIIKMLKSGPPPSRPATQLSREIPRPVALVLSPTRELTVQIHEESRKFAFQTGIRTVVVYGGANISEQLYDLRRGCDICVATPGRLNDILERSRISMSQVTYLVLDEADRMLDMGFSPQIHQIVSERDMPNSTDGRQTAMFSATFPREIQELAKDFLHDYVYLTVGRVGSTNEFITQKLIYADENEKPKRLLQLLKEARGRVLVFVETKKKADVIEDYLVKQGLHATSIHGDRSQSERSRALEAFKSGAAPILVATDVAARGLDIHSITWVINLDLPHSIEDYVHRIGRTGRAGNAGLATSFVNEGNRHLVRELMRLLEEANQEIPGWFIDLTRACSNAAVRFGSNRYGNGHRRGGGGGARDFGGVDMRNFEDNERRTINAAAMSSPRGGMNRGGGGGGRMGGYGGNGSRRNVQDDDCW